MTKTMLLLIFLLPVSVFGQITITGKVIGQADTKPVANASVFLSNAAIGGKTANDGSFSLQNVKPGRYDLIVSIIGFDVFKQSVIVGGNDVVLPVIAISPKIISLNIITVKASRTDPDREKYYLKFKNEFLGSTNLLKECTIMNPELLDFNFNADSNILRASSVDFLEIENRALGYKLKYLLKDFLLDNSSFDTKLLNYNGYVLYEKLKGTAIQEKEWEKRRREAYEGSQMHFLRAVIDNRVEEEGFRVLRLPVKKGYVPDSVFYIDKKLASGIKKKDSLVTGPDQAGLYNLMSKNSMLYISYNKYHHFNNSSYAKLGNQDNTVVTFNAPWVTFDNNGTITDPHNLTYDGAWARSGVAGLLPVDYDDEQKIVTNADSTLNKIRDKLFKYAGEHVTEKAYLQFDKPYYAAGDTIYFKAYLTQGAQHIPSQLSGVLHADLINADNKVANSIWLALDKGIGWGDFALPDTLVAGNYRVRAYTNLMLNGDGANYFDQLIPIGSLAAKKFAESGSFKKQVIIAKTTIVTHKTDVQFLPEGGNLITSVYSKVGFKAVAENGLGTDVKGTVVDDLGAEVCTFASTHLGMGAFSFVPEAGRTYKAQLNYIDGTTATIDLPKATGAGYTISINNTDADNVRLRVTAGGVSLTDKLSLVAQAGGIIYYAAESGPFNKFFTAVIPKRKFPSGIVQFTLFNAAGEPLTERLAFIDNKDQLKIDVSPDKNIYATRQKVKINLNTQNGNGSPSPGSFSVAVTDESKVPVNERNENSILANLLLTSELKGNIEQPNYYFINSNEKTQADLDLLMLTQGYRNFSWKKVFNNQKLPVFYQPETGLTIAGQVTRSNKPLAGCKVSLFTTKGGPFFKDTVSDADGNFAFRDLAYNDSTKFVLQAKANKGQDNVAIKLEGKSPPSVSMVNFAVSNYEASVDTTSGLQPYLNNQKEFYKEQAKLGINQHPALLKEVVIRDKKSFLKHSDNLNGPGNADRVVTADQLKDLPGNTLSFRLGQILMGSVFFRYGVPYRGPPQLHAPMQIIIDGDFVSYNDYDHLDPDRVQSVEVLSSPSYGTAYGSKGGDGILLITTKRGEDYKREQEHSGVNKPPVLLKEVHVKAKKEPAIPHSDNLNGAGVADQVVSAKELEKLVCGRIVDCLSGVLTSVMFRGGVPLNARMHLAKMAVVIDGNFLDDNDYDILDNLHAEDIEGIEVVLGPHYGAIYGQRMANGGLIITTKRAQKINNYYRYAPGVTTFAAEGYYKAREFYSPQYNSPLANQQARDLRSTIYWKPNITTDKDGKASFEYFNADGKGTYRIVIEGIDADGNLGRQVYRYKVE
ncbi:carboxypeptidase regulatory-like domain-containing protein [Mucilaginibacter sp. BJC16-A38]|uniref:carboxypeptidase regulatory-like domain-containing protein n=1 Tax=Mucilaginibacter phenanthrenivorans TaxID=1234842 RepID=UPI002157C0EF|nr:carboxypeptidase regulatory-like domain-containing protein [Mucilaginibacter phenanthrenivorans]MCR8561016.1 carboxypeptidase regulatory-like domain-containing protein [Mucilaginibacter phenanthrenivorans]